MQEALRFWDVVLRGFFGAGLATLGFAVLFNIRGRALLFCSIAGGFGGLVYNFCYFTLGMNAAISNFFGAVALTVCAEIFARRLKMTVTTFLACALIPLVPGGDAYRMMSAFMNGTIYPGLQYMLETMTIAGMLALGILLVSSLTRLFFYSRRKMVEVREITVTYISRADRRHKQSARMRRERRARRRSTEQTLEGNRDRKDGKPEEPSRTEHSSSD